MGLNAAVQLEIRFGGSDTNGGGFKAGASGMDWTLQDTAQYSVTDGVTAGTTTITSATAAFGTDVVGNLIYVQGGTGSVAANWYEITARTNSTTITVDRSTGLTAGTGVTLRIGGAFATPGVLSTVTGGIGGVLTAGMKAWWKYNASDYVCSSASLGPAGLCKLPSNTNFILEGYDATRGDRTGNRPNYKFTAGNQGSTTTIIAHTSNSGSQQLIANCSADGQSANNVRGFDAAQSRAAIESCVAKNCNGTSGIGFYVSASSARAFACRADTCATGFEGACDCKRCVAVSCTTGFNGAGTLSDCLAVSCTTGVGGTTGSNIANCTADSCGTGFSTGQVCVYNCLATNCTSTGFNAGTTTIMDLCAGYNNVAHVGGTPFYNRGFVTLTADPYVNQAGGDYRPNSTSGGGADLRAAGYAVVGQADSRDIGAVQHTDPSGGGDTIVIKRRKRNI